MLRDKFAYKMSAGIKSNLDIVYDNGKLAYPSKRFSSIREHIHIVTMKVGDIVEVLQSTNPNYIGKRVKVHIINKNDGRVTVIGLPGIENEPYVFMDYKLKVVELKDQINIKDSICYTKPDLNGANCSNCGVFNEYQTQAFICYECK
jgi:hypothetical protein